MENLEISAKTVEEAIQRALEQLGVSRDEVEVVVVKEGRSGILGFGAEEAVVMVKPLVSAPRSDVAETAKGVLERLLALLGLTGVEVVQAQPMVGAPTSITLNVKGDDLGILIGRQGQTLAVLQYIVRLIVSHERKTEAPIAVDVEGYKQRRHQALQAFAQRMAEQVKAKGTPFTMEPMPAYERRIVHLALADHPDVTTESIGEGESRQVVILPKKK